MSRLKKFSLKKLFKNKILITRIILITLIFFMLALTFDSIKRIFVIVIFILINTITAFSKRFLIKRFIKDFIKGIEFIMFCTILTSFAYGPKLGLIMGGLFMAINYISEDRFSVYLIYTIPVYMIIGYISGFFTHLNLVLYAMTVTLIYNLITILMVVKTAGKFPKGIFKFAASNILFNQFLFTTYGQIVLNLIKIN